MKKGKKYPCLIFFFYLANIIPLSAQTSNIVDYDKPGTYSYTVPAGVTELVMECWGGGGGGSAAIGMKQGTNAAPGAGGGGGGHAHSVVKVTPGQKFSIVLGAGGAGGTNPYTLGSGEGKPGQNTAFYDITGQPLVVGEGGRGATFVRLSQGGSKGGSGGSYMGSKGTVIHTGGSGADAGSNYSGGGGGGGGRTHEGYNASGINAGAHGSCYCGIPGAGGAGRNTTGTGNPGVNTENLVRGVIYSAGGGSGGFDSEWGTQNGGKGADGHVRIKEQQVMGDITGPTYTEVGKTIQLIPPISGGTWLSSRVDIATVDGTGRVTGITSGETVITYNVGTLLTGQSTEYHVNVYPVERSISITGLRSYCGAEKDINLKASTDIGNYDVSWYWIGPNGFHSGEAGFTRTPIAANAGVYTVTATLFSIGNSSANKIVNGNFEADNTGFTSKYTYKPTASNQAVGEYNIANKPQNWAFINGACVDHTSGSGKYFSLMGINTADTVWIQTVSVNPNTNYQLSYWMQAMQASDQSTSVNIKIQAGISGEQLGPVLSKASSKECGGWIKFTYNWNSGNNTSAKISLKLAEAMSSSYQVGLDDIEFREIASDAFSVRTADVYVEIGTSFTPTIQILSTPAIPEAGQKNMFVASTQYAGIDPTFIWYINGVEKQRGSKPAYTDSTLLENDIVLCQLVPDSNLTCLSPGPFNSTPVVIKKSDKNYWIGVASNKWYVVDNWTALKVPSVGEDVEFATLTTAGQEVAHDLEITGDITIGNYANLTDKQLIVIPGSSLTIKGQVDAGCECSKMLIEASETTPNGSILLSDTTNAPLATVEMWSKASIDNTATTNNKIKWQYFGIPVESLTASPTFNGAYIRQYKESKQTATAGLQWDELLGTSIMSPFLGYEIGQESPMKYKISGRLVKHNFSEELTYTSGSHYIGQHILSNPYTAAIDIEKMNFGEGLDKTIYLYNTGSYVEWGNQIVGNEIPGYYIAVPQEQAKAMGFQIPSMQGFLVRVNDASKSRILSFYYNDVVKNTLSLRSVAYKTYLIASLGSKHYGDKAWLFEEAHCTPGYDNGWDGYKLFTTQSSAQLFIYEGDKSYQVSSTDCVDGVYLGFYAGEKDTEYTLHLESSFLGDRYESLYLVDLEEGIATDILVPDASYTFTAIPGERKVKRFQIVSDPKASFVNEDFVSVYIKDQRMYVTNRGSEQGELAVFDLAGRCLLSQQIFLANAITTIPISFAPGVYLVKKIYKDKIQTTKVIVYVH